MEDHDRENSGSNFHHDFNPPIPEMEHDEYQLELKRTLVQLKRRILSLGITYLLTGVITLVLTIVVHVQYHSSPRLAQGILIASVSLKSLFIAITCLTIALCAVAFSIHARWKQLKRHEVALLLWCSALVVMSTLVWLMSLWFFIGTIITFSQFSLQTLTSGSSVFGLVQLSSFITGLVLVAIPPPVLRTISRKLWIARTFFQADILTPEQVEERLKKQDPEEGFTLSMENVVPVDEEAKPKTDGNYAAVVPDFGTTDLTKSEYLVFWKSRPPTGSFSCHFTNDVTLAQIQMHLQSNGFTVVRSSKKQDVLTIAFGARGFGERDPVFFAGEFILISTRRYFQATFKCDSSADGTAEFVQNFQLQHLLKVMDPENNQMDI